MFMTRVDALYCLLARYDYILMVIATDGEGFTTIPFPQITGQE